MSDALPIVSNVANADVWAIMRTCRRKNLAGRAFAA
jgi:hypothetical protein